MEKIFVKTVDNCVKMESCLNWLVVCVGLRALGLISSLPRSPTWCTLVKTSTWR